ncbi:lytic transglycosylase domain-containing protein [Paracoccus sp. (in: a-proteobacteria)]|uniref:lytic transglycosylase domain-containing protein n=1 Tax=Paracoccus sp. TaxID=267 RepID=UPI0026E01047|nr:lytic transglycosylase domain-containing protein [Paracoccus sp. (in: a-proteobacteria)]MDO5648543.1 lytic transglycosylase domain-containing protein [Paracoccus sp. (in: a-proteobacteria)]
MRHLRHIILAGFLAAPLPAASEDAGAMALALSAAEARDWVTAWDAATVSGPMAQALVGWQSLRAGHGSFDDYLDFVTQNPDWPGLDQLQQRGDAKLRAGLPQGQVAQWFSGRKPTTYRALTAYTATLGDEAARAERKRFFLTQPMSESDQAAMLESYGSELAPHLLARAIGMLDRRDWAQAERLIDDIDPVQQPLLAARIALQAGRDGVDDLILALPDDQRADPGLTMDRFLWRVSARQHDGAQALMLESSGSAHDLRDPDQWAQMRVDYTRLAMRNGDWQRARDLATPHHLAPSNRHYADLEWLAGWAALKTDAPDVALDHFRHLETVVRSAISLSRAFYWQGRALQDLGDDAGARAQMERAAALPATYYGQLAANEIGAPMPPEYAIPGAAFDTLPDWRSSALRDDPVFRAGLWLLATGRRDEAQRFFLHLSRSAEPDDIARMARLMYEYGAPWHGLRLAKQSANKAVVWPVAHFPLTGLENERLGPPPELVMSIARQESEFNHTARSHAGAQGLMQVMPATAEQVTRRIGIPFDADRLAGDAAYNAVIGSAYLSGLADRFGPSVALIASGYNAGPGRPARWLSDFGDLRTDAIDPVDWVELIPFDETRNYVMRVTEAMPIYRARISGTPAAIDPRHDLSGGGEMPPPPPSLTLDRSAPPPRASFGPPAP